MTEPGPDAPVQLRVVRGTPSDAELAALVVALASVPTVARAEPPPVPSRWADYWRGRSRSVPPGPGAWRGSLR